MRHGVLMLLSVLAIGLLVGSVSAGTEIDLSGQIRARAELDQKSFDPNDGTRQYTYLRTRILAKAMISDNTHGVVQFQDSRTLGVGGYSGDHATGDAKNVDVHQAYLQVDQLWNGGPGIKVGRFEVVLGNERVFGAVGWHNIGRSWEGVQAFREMSKLRLDAFMLKRLERDSYVGNADFDVFGLNATVKNAHLDVFGFLENDALKDEMTESDITYVADHQNLKRYTFGLYTKQTYEQFDFEYNAAFQTGKQMYWNDTISAEADLSGVMFTGEAGYTFDSKRKPRLAVGVDYTSGDDIADNEYKSYSNMYYTGHKFRGFMDYFLASNEAGLMDIMLRGKVDVVSGWTVKGDVHLFSTAVDYSYMAGDATAATKTKDVGTEIDVTVSTNRIAGVKFAAGGGIFMVKDAWAATNDQVTNPETATWGWLQMIADF